MKDENGSVFLMTLIIFSLLLILGFAILSISATNYSIQQMNFKSKQCFYIAEGGLEIVYGQIVCEIQNAINDGQDKLNYFMENEYENFILMEDDEKKINQKLNEEFAKGYKNYFLGNKKSNFIKNIEKIKVDDVKINLIDDDVNFENNNIKFSIASSYRKERIEKEITIDFHIKIPNKDEKNVDELVELKNWIRRR